MGLQGLRREPADRGRKHPLNFNGQRGRWETDSSTDTAGVLASVTPSPASTGVLVVSALQLIAAHHCPPPVPHPLPPLHKPRHSPESPSLVLALPPIPPSPSSPASIQISSALIVAKGGSELDRVDPHHEKEPPCSAFLCVHPCR
jgi:hypothetical protein